MVGEETGQESREHSGTLSSPAFIALMVTQFLGALNDNTFRWFAIMTAIPAFGAAGASVAIPLGMVLFTLPYLLLASYSAYFADRYDKRTVIVACKVAEIVIMVLAVLAVLSGNVVMLLAVVFIMGSQSALFSPSRLGCIPELVRKDKISSANGLIGMVTIVASAMGLTAGMVLQDSSGTDIQQAATLTQMLVPAVAMIGTAVLGTLSSLLIVHLPPADPTRRIPRNPFAETVKALRTLARHRPLLRAAFGGGRFWFLASMANMNIEVYGANELQLESGFDKAMLGVSLVAGIGLGSVLAGTWSAGKVELGIVPLGAIIITIGALCLYVAAPDLPVSSDPATAAADLTAVLSASFYSACIWMFVLGVGGGLFIVPLVSFLQDRSDIRIRGTILAATNFIEFSLMMLAAAAFYVMTSDGLLEYGGRHVFLVTGLGTIPVLLYVLWLLPQASSRFLLWLTSKTVYRLKVHGAENIPEQDGALLVANHVTWLDGVLLLISSSRPIRMLAYTDHVTGRFIGFFSRLFGVIPIKAGDGPGSLRRSLETASEAIRNGELVCIFPEGELTRTGELGPFQRGMMTVIKGTGAPIIPVYLDELWGSIFSFERDRYFWKWPRAWPYPVSIHFGRPLPAPESVDEVRRAIVDLGVEAVDARKDQRMVPPRVMIRKCRGALRREKVADSGGASLTGGRLLAGTIAMKRVLRRSVLADDEKMVGLLVPPTVGATIANTALAFDQRVAVNLNYTLSKDVVDFCIRECGIRTVLTSRKFLEKRPFETDEAELVFLEDLKEQVTGTDRLVGALQAYCTPKWMLDRIHRLHTVKPDDLLTVIFTSGSTGEPKGVMLSHNNIASNIDSVDQLFHITPEDVVMGVLPFFHSFGYTGTLWLTMMLEPKCGFHVNPLDPRTIGQLCQDHGVSVMLATPTFLRSYMRRCTPEQMHNLDLVIVGGEKLPVDIAAQFKEKFGVEPTEGYGTTELSPVASFNVPSHRAPKARGVTTRLGTVGLTIPGGEIRIVDPDTREELGTDTEGLMLYRGPNVMVGYLNREEATAEKIKDGWYDTGDMAKIADDGFITITGRMSRFSKIGGEMVPHIRIEELLERAIEGGEEDATVQCAVTAVPDVRKGERLIVLHRPMTQPIDQLLQALSDAGLPNIWIPSATSFLEVDEIPLLGTGKIDLQQIKQKALEAFGDGE